MIGRAPGREPDSIDEAIQEQRDEQRAARAQRLEAFLAGKPVERIWELDLLPLLEGLHYSYMQKVLNKEVDAVEGMRALQQFVALLGGGIELGKKAMERIAQRRMERSRDVGR